MVLPAITSRVTCRGYSTVYKLDKLGPRSAATLLWCHTPARRSSRVRFLAPLQRRIRKVGAPLGVIIALGALAVLLLILLTTVKPVGTAVGFVLSTMATAIVLLVYLWLDRWEPEPPRLLVLAFVWGASVAVIISVGLELYLESLIHHGQTKTVSAASVAIGAPMIEEAAKGLFLLILMTGRRRNELNSLTDCLVYAGITAAGFAWLENIIYIAKADTIAGSLVTAALRLIMGPFAHPLFTTMTGIGVYFALQQRNVIAKAGCILLGYLGAVIMHGVVERLVAARREGLHPGLPAVDGADLRVGDRARRRQPTQGTACRCRQAARHGGRWPGDPQRSDVAGFHPRPEVGDRRSDPARGAARR